ncbi:MAG TPA: PQQ-binding-like beta-propeller repeat protein, partial [Steroidobacteraceae bacterium]
MKTNKELSVMVRCNQGLCGALLAVAGVLAILPLKTAAAASPADWPMFGLNTQNTASDGRLLGDPSNLKVKWTFTTGGDVSARAAVVNGVVYFPDWGPPGSGSNLWAVNANTGKMVWGHQLSDYGLPAATHSRTSPAVVGGVLYLGTQEGAYLLAINATTGNLIWKTQLESQGNDPLAIVTASPTVYGGAVYTGVASVQEGAAASPQFPCCSARGSVVKIDAATGAIIWKSYTVPASGYTGGGAWGSNFVVDPTRRSVFLGTGNNYKQSTDPTYLACIGGGGTPAGCSSTDNHVDSILALDMDTGAIKWSTRAVT